VVAGIGNRLWMMIPASTDNRHSVIYATMARRHLTIVGQVIYGLVMVVGTLADVGILVWLFLSHHAGWGILYLVIGFTITLTVFHWIGLALAAPFVAIGETGRPKADRYVATGQRTVPISAARPPGKGWINPPPGWYPDPDPNSDVQRWWEGDHWSMHTKPKVE
jgi:hypothetical protein